MKIEQKGVALVQTIKPFFVTITLFMFFAFPVVAQAQNSSQPSAPTQVQSQETKAPVRKKGFPCNIGRAFKGMASWYGGKFSGKRTASGKKFDKNELTCASPNLPFGTDVQVTNPDNGSKVNVTVTDRGPFHGNRVIDLSKGAARKLGIGGIGKVVCKIMGKHKIASAEKQ